MNATDVRAAVAEALEQDPAALGDEDDLLDAGLDSLRLMALVTAWQDAGHDVDFADLIEQPTLGHWVGLLVR